MANFQIKLLLVEDGSHDDSFEKLAGAAQTRDWLGYIRFTANFGHQAALIAGMTSIDEWPDAVLTMDSDLEHPVSAAEKLIEKWAEKKYILINGIRNDHAELSLEKRLTSRLFYKLMARIAGVQIQPGQSDFCIWDGVLLRSLKLYLLHIGSLRVFAAWIPGSKAVVTYDQKVIPGRLSRFTFVKRWELAISSIIRFSSSPLRLIFWLGLFGIAISIIHAIQISYAWMQGEVLQPGWPTLILTVILMGCLQLLCLSILATYLRRLVFSKDLPLFLIREEKKLS